MYAGDYDDITVLKNISDRFGIAVVIVHHVRKMKDANDPFNEVTGSTGITGAADTSFILKCSRSSEMGTLLATGRDIEYQELPEEKSEILDFFEKSGDDCYYLGFSDRFIDGIATLDDETLAVLSTEMTDGIAGSTYLKVLNLKTGGNE